MKKKKKQKGDVQMPGDASQSRSRRLMYTVHDARFTVYEASERENEKREDDDDNDGVLL